MTSAVVNSKSCEIQRACWRESLALVTEDSDEDVANGRRKLADSPYL